jgi:hypothetical protein
MDGFVVSGYDVLMVIWGCVFIVGAVGFIFGMNRLFQSEERRQDRTLDLATPTDNGDSHHYRPAA